MMLAQSSGRGWRNRRALGYHGLAAQAMPLRKRRET